MFYIFVIKIFYPSWLLFEHRVCVVNDYVDRVTAYSHYENIRFLTNTFAKTKHFSLSRFCMVIWGPIIVLITKKVETLVTLSLGMANWWPKKNQKFPRQTTRHKLIFKHHALRWLSGTAGKRKDNDTGLTKLSRLVLILLSLKIPFLDIVPLFSHLV